MLYLGTVYLSPTNYERNNSEDFMGDSRRINAFNVTKGRYYHTG